MNFLSIDVETSNPDFSSICQIGIVEFESGKIINTWESLVNPEDYFSPINIDIHGITEESVLGAPRFQDLYEHLAQTMTNKIVVSHTAFDRVSINRALEKYDLRNINCIWLDSAKVARRTWSEFSFSGYGLKNIARSLNIEFQHHNAKEDARAAGEILLRAIKETGLSIEGWLERVKNPLDLTSCKISQEGNPDGPLAGEEMVFTGALSIPRHDAAAMAANAGCTVSNTVNKKTTLLVVGDQDIRKLGGQSKSSKHRKAEEYIFGGQQIRILGESDFLKLIEHK